MKGQIMSEQITLSAADGQFAAYVARPCTRHAPVVIVLQEIFGVNTDIRGMCDELAEHGFIAMAPDLFWRTKPELDLNLTCNFIRIMQMYSTAMENIISEPAINYWQKKII